MRVGLVGAGFMGSVHLEAYRQMSNVEVVGVADARPEVAAAGAAPLGARAYASYEELAAAEDVDVVDVCLPTPLRREAAERVARDGKHLILEKPLANSLEDARAILDAFAASGTRLFVGHVVRFFPEYVMVREMVRSGELGTVGVVRTSRRSPFLLGWNDWYADRRASGGVLLDLVIHDFDFLRWCFGPVERVFARSVAGNEYNRVDHALVTLRFASGEICHVEGQWGYPGAFNYAMEVAGSRGLVTLDSTEPGPVRLFGEEGPQNVPVGGSPYAAELEHFIRCLERGEEALVSPEDAYEAVRISLAAAESAATGRPVYLAEAA
jgi:UDP-N-acetylglucosamine 3-dehydrogenase